MKMAGSNTCGAGYWHLVGAGEPFRLLFPVGAILGVVGVLLWPLYYLSFLEAYPGVSHSRIMIQGFLTAFVLGFLGTALPRLLDVSRFALSVSIVFAALLIAGALFSLCVSPALGDLWHFVLLILFLGVLAKRARNRKDLPPPGFILVAFGLVSGMIGSLLLFLDAVVSGFPLFLYQLARLLAWQGFLLFPVLGVGAFLLPRFFHLENQHSFPEMMLPNRRWMRKAYFVLLCGIGIFLSFVLEVAGYFSSGNALRAAIVFLYFSREIPLCRATNVRGSLARSLKVALLSFPLGYGIVALFPSYSLAWIHVVFILGFSLITFTVASRVIYGHSGNSAGFNGRIVSIDIMILAFFLALAARVLAEYQPSARMELYALSGTLWIFAVLFWGVQFLPRVRIADAE